MLVSLIAAMGRGRVLAGEHGIPWDMPRDREHFRAYTAGKAMLLGRRTYGEMRGWFTSQLPIVLTSRSAAEAQARHVVRDAAAAVALASRLGAPELVVSGGGMTYKAALPLVQRMILTLIDADFEGRICFPEWEASEWREICVEDFPADHANPHPMRIITLDRIPA